MTSKDNDQKERQLERARQIMEAGVFFGDFEWNEDKTAIRLIKPIEGSQ